MLYKYKLYFYQPNRNSVFAQNLLESCLIFAIIHYDLFPFLPANVF